jgi:hypothetical protein
VVRESFDGITDGHVLRRRSKAFPLTPTLSPKGARGKGADLQGFQDLSSTHKGEGSWSSGFSGFELASGLSGRCNKIRQLGRLPLPLGEGWGEGALELAFAVLKA